MLKVTRKCSDSFCLTRWSKHNIQNSRITRHYFTECVYKFKSIPHSLNNIRSIIPGQGSLLVHSCQLKSRIANKSSNIPILRATGSYATENPSTMNDHSLYRSIMVSHEGRSTSYTKGLTNNVIYVFDVVKLAAVY